MDHDSVDVATALRAFEAHPWQDELTFESEPEKGGVWPDRPDAPRMW